MSSCPLEWVVERSLVVDRVPGFPGLCGAKPPRPGPRSLLGIRALRLVIVTCVWARIGGLGVWAVPIVGGGAIGGAEDHQDDPAEYGDEAEKPPPAGPAGVVQSADLHGQERQERRQSVGLEENRIAEYADPEHAETVADMPIPNVPVCGMWVSLPIPAKAMPMIAFTRTNIQYSRRRARPRKPV